MNRARQKTGNNIRRGFMPRVALTAEGDEIRERIIFTHRVRNNVVNVELSGRATPSARAAFMPVSLPRKAGLCRPIKSPPVVLGGSALPLWAFLSRKRTIARGDVATMRAKFSRLTIKIRKRLTAGFAICIGTPVTSPSVFVVARHCAKEPGFSLVSEGLKNFPASLARFFDAGFRLPLATGFPAIPCRASVGPKAWHGAVFSSSRPCESGPALFACMINGFHAKNITGTPFKYKDFEIACKRVYEATRQPDLFVEPPAPKPQQEGWDI